MINLENIQQPGEIINMFKTIFVIISVYYTNFKIMNIKINKDLKNFLKFILVIISAGIGGIIKYNGNDLISLSISIFLIGAIFLKSDIFNGILVTMISFVINYIVSIISIAIGFVINISIKINNQYINLIIILLFHILLLRKVFKIRRIKYGIEFLKKRLDNEFFNIIILNISIIILALTTVMVNSNVGLGMELFPYIIICIIIMFITIQKSLQLYYKQKMLVKELEETKAELSNKVKEIEDLEKENITISKKAHSLSHKQKALQSKLEEMLMNQEISKEEAAEVRDRLKEIGKDLYKQKETIKLDKTGIVLIDDMLSHLQKECNKNKIDFELQLKGNIHYMVNNLIAKEDLEILLADHVVNAIIAINHTENVNRSILVRLGEIDGIYSLYIYDSGIEFEKETLKNLGKKPSTTHKDEGGTGMGFMNTFDTLRKCEASLIIEQIGQPSKDNYTKAIIIKFDKKKEFKII